MTQSGGSRYESGREMPKPVRELLRLVHVEQIDLSEVKRVDFEIIKYLKDSHPDLYRSLRRAVRSRHRPGTVPGLEASELEDIEAEAPTAARWSSPGSSLDDLHTSDGAHGRRLRFRVPVYTRARRTRAVKLILLRAVDRSHPEGASVSEVVRVIPFERLRMTDVDEVGGKNASLGEMIGQLSGAGIRVPGGFATTAAAFREFIAKSGLAERIARRLESFDVDDVAELARAGSEIRRWVTRGAVATGARHRDSGCLCAPHRERSRCFVGRPLVGDRRGPARCVVRRPAGNISKYQGTG